MCQYAFLFFHQDVPWFCRCALLHNLLYVLFCIGVPENLQCRNEIYVPCFILYFLYVIGYVLNIDNLSRILYIRHISYILLYKILSYLLSLRGLFTQRNPLESHLICDKSVRCGFQYFILHIAGWVLNRSAINTAK